MIDTKLRNRVQPIFNKIAGLFIRLKIEPDTITFGAFFVGIAAGIMIAFDRMYLGVLLLWLSGLLDVLDGTVARLENKSSNLGAYMDLIFDRMVESGIILGFYFLYPEYALAYILFFIAVLFNFTTFIVAGATFKNEGVKSMHHDVGIAERTETFIVFTIMMVLPSMIFPVLLAFNGIIFLTGILRFQRILRAEKFNK